MREEIKLKIKQMDTNNTIFKLKCNEYIIEFRLFKTNSITFLAVSGGMVAFNTYFLSNFTNYNNIIVDIENKLFRKLNLNIEDSKFVN